MVVDTKNIVGITKAYITPRLMDDMKSWCIEHFGPRRSNTTDGVWDIEWAGPQVFYGTKYTWYFLNPKDATIFALKWT